jgi:hypothetical protein
MAQFFPGVVASLKIVVFDRLSDLILKKTLKNMHLPGSEYRTQNKYYLYSLTILVFIFCSMFRMRFLFTLAIASEMKYLLRQRRPGT